MKKLKTQKPISEKKLKPREREHYVNGKEFENEIREYYKTNIVTDKLADSIMKIAHGLSYAPNFINYSYKSDMVGDAILKMYTALKNKKFRVDTGFNPFSYMTTVSFHAFINRIKKEKKHHDTINEYKERIYTDAMKEENVYIDPTHEEQDF